MTIDGALLFSILMAAIATSRATPALAQACAPNKRRCAVLDGVSYC